jgi:hypothetical protein
VCVCCVWWRGDFGLWGGRVVLLGALRWAAVARSVSVTFPPAGSEGGGEGGSLWSSPAVYVCCGRGCAACGHEHSPRSRASTPANAPSVIRGHSQRDATHSQGV